MKGQNDHVSMSVVVNTLYIARYRILDTKCSIIESSLPKNMQRSMNMLC